MHAAIRENALMRALRLRRVDRTLTLLLTAYFFFALTSVTIVKSLQKGIYLGTIGFDWQLPALYLVLALLSSPIVFLYRYLARHYSHILITTFTLLILGAGMTLFMLGRNHAESWAYHAFYLWAAVFSVLVPTQGWIFSYHLFTSRQAKRTFVIMGTGGILGGVVGGYYTAAVAGFFTANGLFIHVLVLLALMEAVLLGVFWHGKKKRLRSSRGARPDQKSERPQLFQAVLRSRHLGYLAGLILLTGLVSTLIDLQFNWSLDDRFTDAEIPITQFVGGLQGTIYLLSALVQLFGTSQILHRFGLGLGLMILPLGLITGSLGMMFTANFWSVVTAKTFDGSLRSSIEQTSVELLYVPLSQRESIPVKSFVELVILRVGDGLGAALFLLVASFFSPPLQAVGIVVLLVCIVWLFTSQQIAEEYSKMLRRSLEDMDSRTVRRALEISEAVAENTLVGALQSKNSNKVHFALQQLRFQDAEPGLQEISSNDLSGEVLSMDVSGIYQFSSRAPRWLKYVEPLTEHADRRVGAVAIHLMMTYKVPGHFERLVARMQSTEVPEDRYLTYLQEYAEDPNELLRSKYLLHWCGVARPEQCVNLAFLLGVTRNPTYVLTLRDWLNSPHRNLQKAAMRALGEFGEPQDIDTLMRFLAHNWSRRAAIKALTRYGEKIVSTMLTQLRNPKVDIAIKREIPSVLSQIDSSSARGVLVAALYTHDSVVAYRALKGLNLIRDERDLSYSQDSFIPLLQIWAKEYYGLANIDSLLYSRRTQASRLLQKAIKERINWSIEKIFRGLDLFLPHGDAYFSYLGFTSSRQDLRENAIELIDSRIRGELRQTLLPIFSELHPIDVVTKGREIFQLPSEPQEALSEAFYQGDPWLKCCTIAAAASERMDGLRNLVEQARNEINPLVRETAEWAVQYWDQQDQSD